MSWPPTPKPRPKRTLSPEMILVTWFGAGFLRPAPGSWASAVALGIAWLATDITQPRSWIMLPAALLLFPFGWYACERVMTGQRARDPSWIVIDEVVGQWIAVSPLPRDLTYFLSAFLMFRLLDIAKPPPIDWVERKVKGGLGIMLDDLVAGVVAAAFLFFAKWLFRTE